MIGAGGSVNFPVTPVPAQAAAFIEASGLMRTPGDPYYHSAFGDAVRAAHGLRRQRPVGGGGGPVIRDELEAAGFDTTLLPVDGASQTGQVLAAGFADLAVLPVNFTPYLSQTWPWYTTLLGPTGKNGSQDWTGYSSSQFDQLVRNGLAAAQPEHGGRLLHAGGHACCGTTWSRCRCSPSRRPWSGAGRIGGVTPMPRSDSLLWFAQLWAVRVRESTSNTTPSLPGQ